MNNTTKNLMSALFGIGVFLFWWLIHPYDLTFQEQNQLFLYTWAYLGERLSVSGGLADYVAEFMTQFNVFPWLGALLIGIMFVKYQKLVSLTCKKDNGWYALSFLPACLLLIYMGDIYTMLSYGVALTYTVWLCYLYNKMPNIIFASIATILGYWLFGPATFIFTLYVAIKEHNVKSLVLVVIAIATLVIAKMTFLSQYQWKMVVFGINYYRLPLTVPVMQIVIGVTTLLILLVNDILSEPKTTPNFAAFAVFVVIAAVGSIFSFKKDTHEVIAFDQLVRQEKWEKILKRAKKYQPDSEVSSVCINLAVFMCGNTNKITEYKQFGTRGLILPNIRDFISNSGSCEVFWRLGMINESLRYAFDSQESEINYRKSGRWTSRMAECQILNGRYDVAEKYLDILSQSLFYRKWAKEHKAFLNDEQKILSDPVYGYLQQVRQQDDFLYYYPEMEKMLGRLYLTNKNNIMAAWYYQVWASMSIDINGNEEDNSYGVHGS